MCIRDRRDVEQVVVDQVVIGTDRFEMTVAAVPATIAAAVQELGYRRRVGGAGGIAEPDPDIAVPFEDGVARNPCPGWYEILARYVRAGAGRVELRPMVAALDAFADHAPERQR